MATLLEYAYNPAHFLAFDARFRLVNKGGTAQ